MSFIAGIQECKESCVAADWGSDGATIGDPFNNGMPSHFDKKRLCKKHCRVSFRSCNGNCKGGRRQLAALDGDTDEESGGSSVAARRQLKVGDGSGLARTVRQCRSLTCHRLSTAFPDLFTVVSLL